MDLQARMSTLKNQLESIRQQKKDLYSEIQKLYEDELVTIGRLSEIENLIQVIQNEFHENT